MDHIDDDALEQLAKLLNETADTLEAFMSGEYNDPSTEEQWLERLWRIAQRAALPYGMQSALSAKRRAER